MFSSVILGPVTSIFSYPPFFFLTKYMRLNLINHLIRIFLARIMPLPVVMVTLFPQHLQAINDVVELDRSDSATTVITEDDSDLSRKEFFYYFLLGDIAWHRGNAEVAATALAKAAVISGDPGIVLRAYHIALEAGRGDIAVEMAKYVLEKDSNTIRGNAMLLRAYIAGDNAEDAHRVLVNLFEQSSKVDSIVHFIGEALGSAPNAKQWLGMTEQVARNLPDSPEAQFVHGFLAHRTGDLDQADIFLNRALELRAGWEDAAILRLSLWSGAGDTEVAKRFGTEFLSDYPDRIRFKLIFARLLAQWRDNAVALEYFRDVIEREPENCDAIFAVALLHLQTKENQAAEEMLRRYLLIEPDDDQARLYLAEIAREEQRYDLALEWLSGVYGEQFYFQAQLTEDRILADKGELDNALDHLGRIIVGSTAEQAQIYLVEEEMLRDAGQMHQALKVLNAALIDIPDDPGLLYARGLIAAQLKHLREHERDMRRLIQINPDNAHAYNALGYTLADESVRLDEALLLIEKAIELQPNDPFILDSLGWVHYRLGDYDLAIGYLRQALEFRPDPEIAAHLGEVLWRRGELESARDVWSDGLTYENGEDNEVLRETIKRLDP